MKQINQQLKSLLKTKFWMRPRRHPYVSAAFVSLLLFFFASFSLVVVNARTLGPDDIKLVTVYDNRSSRSLPTRAQTVAEFISKQKITLGEFDVIQPSLETPLTENFSISIFRATPVTVTDQGETKRFLSAYQDPRLIAEKAGYQLARADIAEWVDPGFNPARSVVIKRARTHTINLYGNLFEHKSFAQSVGEVLSEAGVVVAEGDSIEPVQEQPIVADTTIVISRFGTRIETVDEEIAYEVIKTDDPSQTIGQKTVTKAGENGLKTVVYELELENDQVVGRKVLQEVVVKEPVAQEELRGTKPPVVSHNVSADKQFIMAAAGIAESDWGYVDYIVSHESGWNAGATNRYSGAYGLCQSLPASKMATAGADYRTNPVTQLRWCAGYANGRYGGWSGAYAFWVANRWW